MSRLRFRPRIRGVDPSPPSAGAIAVQAERWAAGSGTTLLALGVPLQEGQLLPANIAGVSVFLGVAEIPVYAEGLGVYPDGTARSLYLQASQSLTNGAPVAGEVRLTGGFTLTRRSFVDNAATFVNNEVGTAWVNAGLPQGAIVPTSAAHICNCMVDGPLVPMATQPVFTGSAAVDTTLMGVGITLFQARTEFPAAAAGYDASMAMFHLWARTADAQYLRLGLSWTSRERTAYWASVGFGLPESEVVQSCAIQWSLLTRDTVMTDTWFRETTEVDSFVAAMPRSSSSVWASTPTNGARFASRWLLNLKTMIMTNPQGANRLGSGSPQISYIEHVDAWLGRVFTAPLWDGNFWTITSFSDPAFTIPITPAVPFQGAILCNAIINLCRTVPSSAATVTALTNVSSALLWLRTNHVVLSSAGSTTFRFASQEYFSSPGVGGGTDPSVDLNGFFPHLYAWRALRENSVADANLARLLYASLGFTPRDGSAGPFISSGKQWEETFHRSQTTLAYLHQSGL